MADSINSITLLGGSQTFLGVLTTIVLLCIFNNNNNFIFSILKEINKKFRRGVSISTIERGKIIEEIKQLEDYKKLIGFIGDKNNKDTSLWSSGIELSNEIIMKENSVQYKYFNENTIAEKFDFVKKSREQHIAPFYTFLFCVVVFLFDEVLISNKVGYNDFFISFLSVFVLASYLFFVIIWIGFFIRSSVSYENDSTQPEAKRIKVSWPFTYRSAIPLALLLLVLFVSYLYPSFCDIHRWFLVGSMAIPVLFIGSYRLKLYIVKGNHTYQFLVGHFSLFLLLSFVFCSLIFLAIKQLSVSYSLLIPYSDCMWLKISIFIFVLFNGLIVPFLLPYYRYRTYLKYARNEAEKSKKESLEVLNELKKKLSNFSKNTGQQPN